MARRQLPQQSAEPGFELLSGRLLLRSGTEEMRVDPKRYRGIGVTELVSDEDGVAALGDEDAGVRVAERVRGHTWDASRVHDPAESAASVPRAEMGTAHGGEDGIGVAAVAAREPMTAKLDGEALD